MLTSAQFAILRTAANADAAAAAMMSGNTPDDTGLAAWFNAPTTFVLWKTRAAVQDIYDAVVWANLTPSDAADGTATWTNRALMCQAKQINLQIMLQGQEFIDTTKANLRAGLQDALSNVPSGAGGGIVSAGWVPVKAIIQRFATRAEMALATGTGTAASPGVATWEGLMDPATASTVRAL